MIQGKWHESGVASYQDASIVVDGDLFVIDIADGSRRRGKLKELQISDRLGNVERRLNLSDGSVFISSDNDQIDHLIKTGWSVSRGIDFVERHLVLAITALILTVSASYGFFKWGVPWASQTIAHALPEQTNTLIGENALGFLDDYLFEPSQLEDFQKKRIRDHFYEEVVPLDSNHQSKSYRLHFRAWNINETPIANALALPSGDIILTDRFVELSGNQNEIDSVLLHEMGHVAYRHSLETVIQATLITTAVVLLTGDASGAADLGVGLGSVLVSTSYSRDNESEADQYAFEHMLNARIDPTAFADIMARMSRDFGEFTIEDEQSRQVDKNRDDLLDYFSSHPNTEKRIKQAKRYAECFEQGLLVCE